jgi:hypothetical protein
MSEQFALCNSMSETAISRRCAKFLVSFPQKKEKNFEFFITEFRNGFPVGRNKNISLKETWDELEAERVRLEHELKKIDELLGIGKKLKKKPTMNATDEEECSIASESVNDGGLSSSSSVASNSSSDEE